MDKKSLTALARQQLKLAVGASSGRSSQTVYGGHRRHLRQTVVALAAGNKLAEHDLSGESTVLVLSGKLELISGERSWKARPAICSSSPPTPATASRPSKT